MFGPRLRRWLVLLLVGVALFVNPVWLFPQEGDERYSYERVRLVPADDEIVYQRDVEWIVDGHHNDLQAVGCEGFVESTGSGRLCAFEQSLADDGPVEVRDVYAERGARPRYVDLWDGYYERVARESNGSVTLDVRPVSAETVLENVSTDVTGVSTEALTESPATRALATSEPVVTRQAPESVRAGEVFRYEGVYYTVVLTDRGVVDWPILSAGVRAFLQLVGVLLSFLGTVLLLGAWLDAR